MNTTLYERLKKARNNLGLSQDYVAKQMDLHRTAIVAIEGNRRKVTTEELEQFSTLYGLSAEYLLYGHESDTNIKMFARAYSELSENDRLEILNLIEFKKQLKKENNNK